MGKLNINNMAHLLVKNLIETYPNDRHIVGENELVEIRDILRKSLDYLDEMMLTLPHVKSESGNYAVMHIGRSGKQ